MTDAASTPDAAPTHLAQTHLEWEDFRIPVRECERDRDGRLLPPQPLPDPIPAHWDKDYDPQSPLPWLWKRAGVSLDNLIRVHGGPDALAADIVLARPAFRAARDWLFHIELLIRRILIVAALLYVGAFAPPQRADKRRASPPPIRPASAPPVWADIGYRLARASFHIPLFAPAPRPPRPPAPRAVSAHRAADAPPPHPHKHLLPQAETPRRERPQTPDWMRVARREIRLARLSMAQLSPEVEARGPRLIRLALPLAVRLAACTRVLADAAPFIRRLARRFAHERFARERRNEPPRRFRLPQCDYFNLARRSFGLRSVARAMPVADAWVYNELWSFQPS